MCGLGLRKVNGCALELERACGERLGLSRKVRLYTKGVELTSVRYEYGGERKVGV